MTAAPLDPHDDIAVAFNRLLEAWAHGFAARLSAEVPYDLGDTEYRIISLFARADVLGPSELAARIGIGLPSISKALAKLRTKGLVTTSRDPHDGRALLVHPTEEGRRVALALRRAGADMARTLVADWDAADVEDLRRLIIGFAEATEKLARKL
ncbi:MarR family winged helix-turn-helix transcriptional regulator [Brevibacterium samyangense]|uniref:MarR family winged helix-turn-helix transcriptional regulator n=1 Tax=Brevibacterium samyangense TaxID=366888 RepID=A0ABN2THT0_9MICO